MPRNKRKEIWLLSIETEGETTVPIKTYWSEDQARKDIEHYKRIAYILSGEHAKVYIEPLALEPPCKTISSWIKIPYNFKLKG